MAKAATKKPKKKAGVSLLLDQRLVLNQWLVGLFEVADFEELTGEMKDPALEGVDDSGVSHFHRRLASRLLKNLLPDDVLLAYDENIVRHWRQIIAGHEKASGHRLYPKYFQYLALLFTEIYLDRFVADPGQLRDDLNTHVKAFNAEIGASDPVEEYAADQLNKLAFMQATGSGKTLLMHVNILQYRHYLGRAPAERRHELALNRVILLTPNEGLSRQHKREFDRSGIPAELFDKDARSLFAGTSIEIIDIHKLREDTGDKTVAVEAFESNNLVLVDEGHRGASGKESGDWIKRRNALCEKGFSFEYSATFKQAVRQNQKLREVYSKGIIFDYSYRYFYADGYGKEYHILNLDDDSKEDRRQDYLTACLLTFYQQRRLWLDRREPVQTWLIESPLLVFVGGSVNAVRTENKRKVSDVVDVLLFLADFTREENRKAVVDRIDRLLKGKAGLLDGAGVEIFANAFTHLVETKRRAAELWADVLEVVFRSKNGSPAVLHVENLKGAEGEIALRLGENDPFGVINVGDAASLAKLCEDYPTRLHVTPDKEFAGSLFHTLDKPDSPVTTLIGSKKFTEGWSSWRVSTMGLMNVGRSEGSEIIQLFGRGVRLKGYGFGLKRSEQVFRERGVRPTGGLKAAELRTLETLGIFGVRSEYMKQFEEELKEERVETKREWFEVTLPVVENKPAVKLRIPLVKPGFEFKQTGPRPTLGLPQGKLKGSKILLDWYPKIQSLKARGIRTDADAAEKHTGVLKKDVHLAFFDWDEIYFELQRYKNEKAFHNLNLSRDALRELMEAEGSWYTLSIPESELEFTGFARVKQWQEIAVALLKKYTERYYKHAKARYESDHLEYRVVDPNDPDIRGNLVFNEDNPEGPGYRVRVPETDTTMVEKLKQLRDEIKKGKLKDLAFDHFAHGNFKPIGFARHLYEPLIYARGSLIEVKPVELNKGERDFVVALRDHYNANKPFFADKELYLLRNQSKGRGIGFFEADNFHPDFILWLLVGKTQYVTFVDPKGLRNLEAWDDPKILFAQTVKEIEERLADKTMVLNSFLVSTTDFEEVNWRGHKTMADFENRHVMFPQGGTGYVGRLIQKALS